MNVCDQAVSATTLFADHIPLVRKLAHQLIAKMPANVEVDDLTQAGLIGLNEAATRFEPTVGATFETFATQRIRGAMMDELRNGDYLSRNVRRQAREMDAAASRVESATGAKATHRQIANEMGVTLAAYHAHRAVQATHIMSIEDMNGAGNDCVFAETHPAPLAECPLPKLQEKQTAEALRDAIDRLPEREQFIIEQYYDRGVILKDIAAVLHITESRVCQLLGRAIERLRDKLRAY